LLFVSPLTVMGLPVPVFEPDVPLLLDVHVAVKPVIVAPPLLAGGVNVTEADAFPRVALPIVGAPGTVAGTKLFDAADGAPVPTALVAVTLQVYALPFVRPDTTIGLPDPVFEPKTPPSVDVHVTV
jgi:hypothetical protein